MNLLDFLIGFLVALLLVFAVFLYKKGGKNSCGGDCSRCRGCKKMQ